MRSISLSAFLLLAALLVLVTYVLTWMAPDFVRHYKDRKLAVEAAWIGHRPGNTGLIFVESPEVYTRQRLVNDRYLQDAWLRAQLEEINRPEAAWLEQAQVEMKHAILGVLAGNEATGSSRRNGGKSDVVSVGISDKVLEELTEIPFETRFRLQAEARDKVRQLILENALDDRHDLSGNTVFGLKFDTSIMPGSDTRLNPTVIVQMKDNPLERLLYPRSSEGARIMDPQDPNRVWIRRPEEFVGYYLGFSGGENIKLDPWQRKILSGIDNNFKDWIDTVERRIQERKEDTASGACGESNALKHDPQSKMCQEIISVDDEGSFVRAGTGSSGQEESKEEDVVRDDAKRWLNDLTFRAVDADEAIGWVTRRDEATMIGRRLPETLLGNARSQCSAKEHLWAGLEGEEREALKSKERNRINGLTYDGFLKLNEAELRTPFQAVPGGWGRYVDSLALLRPPLGSNTCTADVRIDVVDRRLTLYLTAETKPGLDEGRSETLSVPGGEPLSCDDATESDDAKGCEAFTTWLVPRLGLSVEALDDIKEALDPETLASIGTAVSIDNPPVLCRITSEDGNAFLFQGEDDEPEDKLRDRLELFGNIESCGRGRQVQLRLGAFEFFRRMSEVESYTYAAFPRGDVTGVVTETGRQHTISTGAVRDGFASWAGFDSEQRNREYEAVPAVINFASGQNRIDSSPEDSEPELFDFGWSVVKAGDKEPMMVSQLVLVSVPAYLSEIRLSLWKGFLNVDKVPRDRDGEVQFEDEKKPFNEARLEERIDFLMEGYERRTITLKVPPDLTALDGIIIGPNEIFGPQIDDSALACLMPANVTEFDENGTKTDEHYQVDLVIPGERLWRSTVVTLGGAKADRIEVMPDMRGILAQFRLPKDPRKEQRDNRLYVWTSEGNDDAPVEYCAVTKAKADAPEMEDLRGSDALPPDAEEGSGVGRDDAISIDDATEAARGK